MHESWFDETDVALADSAARYAAQRYGFESRQRVPAGERRFSADVWKDMAEMGWLSVSTPEAHGGLGLRVSSICLLAQASGRALIQEPFVTCGVIAPWLVASCANETQRDRLLPPMQAGTLRVACLLDEHAVEWRDGGLHGAHSVVPDADIAEQFLVRAADRLYLLSAEGTGVHRVCYPLLDGRGAATIRLEGAAAIPIGDADAACLAEVSRLGALAMAADSLGAMSAAFEITLEYLKTRHQFGMPLGSNQALQHRMVDMHIAIAEGRAVLGQAIESLQDDAPSAIRDVHAAKSFIGDAARRVTQKAIQLHGGIGVTEECAASHYLRRARVNEQLWGSAERHFLAFMATPEI